MCVYICCVNKQSSHRLPPEARADTVPINLWHSDRWGRVFTYLPNAVLEIFLLGLQKAKKKKITNSVLMRVILIWPRHVNKTKWQPTCTIDDVIWSLGLLLRPPPISQLQSLMIKSQMSDVATPKRPHSNSQEHCDKVRDKRRVFIRGCLWQMEAEKNLESNADVINSLRNKIGDSSLQTWASLYSGGGGGGGIRRSTVFLSWLQ